MQKYSIIVKRGLAWHAFYVWAEDMKAAEIVARCHLISGVTVD